MAAVDFNAEPEFDGRGYDAVIVGAGAAGLYLASLLAGRMRVLVLESGHWAVDGARQELNEIEQTGKRMQDAVATRRRVIGGTTVAWGGQSLPFAPVDFAKWPFGRGELERHYRAANEAMGVDPREYGEETFRMLGMRLPAFDPAKVWFHCSKWAPEPNFRKVFRRGVEREFTVLYNAQFLDAEIRDGRVTEVEMGNFRGERRRFPCGRLVLAAGGLESNRILAWLQARRGFLRGGQAEALGRGYMDHPCVVAGRVEPADGYGFQKAFNTQVRGGRKYSLRLSAPEEWMRASGWLNVSASFLMKKADGEFDPYAELGNFRNLWGGRPGRLGETVASLAATAGALVRDRFIYKRGYLPVLAVTAEQEALPESRITLGREKDRFGIPKLSLHWEVSPMTWRTVVAFCRMVKGEVERLGYGRVNLRREIAEGAEDRTDLLTDVNHHMGGTVMGNDPERSVVDENLTVRNVGNLWVASSSVFPSSSHSNPTLTLLALTHRMSEHLDLRG
jgi:choline dehydrogenase-like flavoprotein